MHNIPGSPGASLGRPHVPYILEVALIVVFQHSSGYNTQKKKTFETSTQSITHSSRHFDHGQSYKTPVAQNLSEFPITQVQAVHAKDGQNALLAVSNVTHTYGTWVIEDLQGPQVMVHTSGPNTRDVEAGGSHSDQGQAGLHS